MIKMTWKRMACQTISICCGWFISKLPVPNRFCSLYGITRSLDRFQCTHTHERKNGPKYVKYDVTLVNIKYDFVIKLKRNFISIHGDETFAWQANNKSQFPIPSVQNHTNPPPPPFTSYIQITCRNCLSV